MAAVPLNPADAPSWFDFVTKFDATYASFYDNYNALMSLGPWIQTAHPELLPQYNSMLQAGAVNADQLNSLKATRDYVSSWLAWVQTGAQDMTGFVTSAAQGAYNAVTSALGLGASDRSAVGSGLGQLGLIPVAYAVLGV